MRPILLLTLFLGLLLAWNPTLTASPEIIYSGEARDGNDLVYREKHTVSYEGDRVMGSLTEYFSPEGEVIATMRSDYSQSLSTPTYLFEDFQSGYREGVRRENGQYVIFKQEEGEKEETRLVGDTRNIFSCQGWHYFLLNNLTLLENESIELNLILPSRLNVYPFEIAQVGTRGDRMEVVVALDNWFFRFFTPKLRLVYDKKERKLVEYEGISNLLDAEGKRQKVTITYQYG